MKYRYLGKTGLIVSRVCLGTMTFGMKDWGCDRKTAHEIVGTFLDNGGNFIDTADMYSNGLAEEMLGEAVKGRNREQIVLATKCFYSMGPSPNARGLSRKHIIESCEASLRRLNTDFIDLYQIHGSDPHTPFEETLRALDDLVHQGKVRYIGCSNLFAWQVLKANGISERLGLASFCSGQYLYNLIMRDVEREILPACADQGMGFICWSPLGSGMLTGKYRKAERPDPGSRIAFRAEADLPRYWNERGFAIVAKVNEIAQKVKKPLSDIALAWLLHDRRVTAVIIGARTTEQLKENLGAGDWDLPDQLWAELNQTAAIDLGYPQQWVDAAYRGHFQVAEF